MSSLKHIQEMHKAAYWATKIIFDVLPAELLEEQVNSSFPTIKATLLHCWSAQITWYNRITATNTIMPNKKYNGSFAHLKEGVLHSQQLYIDLLKDKNEAFLNKELVYVNAQGKEFSQPIYQILLQLSHHNAFHRGQIISFMRQLGFTAEIPQTDLIAWYRNQ